MFFISNCAYVIWSSFINFRVFLLCRYNLNNSKRSNSCFLDLYRNSNYFNIKIISSFFLFYQDIKNQENSKYKIYRVFLLPTLILGSVSASNIGVNVYDYLIWKTRHYFFDLNFAKYYLYWIWVLHILMIINAIFILVLLLQPQSKEQKEQTMKNKQQQKPRVIRILRIFWIIVIVVFLVMQWIISLLLSIGNFKKFVPSMFVEILTFFITMGLCIFKKFIFKN